MLLLLLFNACSPISFLPFNFLYSPQELNIQEEKKKAPKILPFQEKSVGNKNQIKNKTLYKNLQCHHWPEMRKISDWAFTQHSVVCTKLQFLHSGNKFRSFQDNPVFNIKAQSECKPRVTLEFKSGIGKPNLQCLICYWCVVNKLFNYHWFFSSHFSMFFCRISSRNKPLFTPNAAAQIFFNNFIYNPIYSLNSSVPSGAQPPTIGDFWFLSLISSPLPWKWLPHRRRWKTWISFLATSSCHGIKLSSKSVTKYTKDYKDLALRLQENILIKSIKYIQVKYNCN